MKLSQWHKGNIKPVNKGWYECKGSDLVLSEDNCAWRKWNGKHWQWITSCTFRNPTMKKGSLAKATIDNGDFWRGIVKDKK